MPDPGHPKDPRVQNLKLATVSIRPRVQKPRNRSGSGTILARGVPRLSPNLLRGPLRRRKSEQIEVGTARDVRSALEHAIHAGRSMNRHLTICWEYTGVLDAIIATGQLMKLMCDGARRRGHRISYVWVRENGAVVGDHVHILFHLPAALARWYTRRKPGWLKRCGTTKRAGTSVTKRIPGAHPVPNGVRTGSDLYARNLQQLECYLLKHCSRETSKLLGINAKGSCEVVGRRVSISQDLHRKARQDCIHCKG